MSEELNEEIESEVKKRKKEIDTLIEVRHTSDIEGNQGNLEAQLEAEKERNKNLSLIVEVEANRQFELDRNNLLSKIPEARREKIKEFVGDDPSKMETLRGSMILSGQDFDDDDDKPEKTIAGRAVLKGSNPEIETGRSGYSSPIIQKYSDLYGILRSPTSTQSEKDEVEGILDDAFDQIGRGLRSRRRGDNYMLPSGVVSHCMNCGAVVEADLTKVDCPYCGFSWSRGDKLPRNPKFVPV